MKKTLLFIFAFFALTNISFGQSLDDLKTMKTEKEAEKAEAQKGVDAIQAEIDDFKREIELIKGWNLGFSGLIGFDYNKSNNWISNPNQNARSSSLNFSLNGFANFEREKYFWRNDAFMNKAWQDVDLTEADIEASEGLFKNGTVDILTLSSLAGYKIRDNFALSGMGELVTSIGNFLEPGTLDFGVGATWTVFNETEPLHSLDLIIHPLNYHIAFPSESAKDKGIEQATALGLRLKANYSRDFMINDRKLSYTSTLASFIPYGGDKTTFTNDDGTTYEAGLFEYTWLNNVSFDIWKGVGVGLGLGIRRADFEIDKLQSYYTLGLSYTL